MTLPCINVDNRPGSGLLSVTPPLDRTSTSCRLDWNGSPLCDVMILGTGIPLQDRAPTNLVHVIEVKTLSDFCASQRNDHRLADQLSRMLRYRDLETTPCNRVYVSLIVYGKHRIKDGNFQTRVGQRRVNVPYKSYYPLTLQSLRSSFFTLNAYGINCTLLNEPIEGLAAYIYHIAMHCSKPWHQHTTMQLIPSVPSYASLDNPDESHNDALVRNLLYNTISQFPNIGPERATNASMHFNSFADMVDATPEEWSKISKIGPATGRIIVQEIHRRKDGT